MTAFLCEVEERRRRTSLLLDPVRQADFGQFFTPMAVAQHMAGLIANTSDEVTLLDAGAGVGMLFAAVIEALCLRTKPPHLITILAYEADSELVALLQQTLLDCSAFARNYGVVCIGKVFCGDFLRFAEQVLMPGLLDTGERVGMRPNVAILNPPYRKIASKSEERQTLRRLGIETTNLYAGFVATALRLLSPGGELVAITPRSFCSGSYFRPFRKDLLQRAALTHLYLFKSRTDTFRESAVLQETLIFRAQVGASQPDQVAVAHIDTQKARVEPYPLAFSQVVKPGDSECYFHIPEESDEVRLEFKMPLNQIGLRVSTGRVVDFRAEEFLFQQPDVTKAPLIYPIHCQAVRVCWPILGGKKPNALAATDATKALRVPNGNYVLVKRFSAKEQPRRVMAFVYQASDFPGAEKTGVGFENHLNYFHENGNGLELALAHGLAAYLNSDRVDRYFRQFSGHTQVNATDLKNILYPGRDELFTMGQRELGQAT